ncbi:MAG: aconitate hydratase AcnA [Pseudomonadales bacterium]|nr:aconitate hydratase AcnA [Pseudomonadales bacterium]MBO6594742.1 aconitate hydratase AcnA [Pseudomonadales bacterium]MBO6821698.1 aconitate hydratase AcnA [Pseudomonadales bacterium]
MTDKIQVGDAQYTIFPFDGLDEARVKRLPFALKILLENLLRHRGQLHVQESDIDALVNWDSKAEPDTEIAFVPSRVLLQDFTGVPAIVDLAAMRDAMADLGGDVSKINPQVPVELVIDHSVMVDIYGTESALEQNTAIEIERNIERYRFLRWGQEAFENFKVVPPGTGIVHQVNLEFLARGVMVNDQGQAYPDTLVGTDSHTTMINGLGVLGWGVGGIEAEAAMLGQPISMLIPKVVGFQLTGALTEGATATDLVLVVTQMLREHGVVGKFVEFFGNGLESLTLADRATIANMAPEYGATCGIFPVDQKTIDYMQLTGRTDEQLQLAETYMKTMGLWHDPSAPKADYSSELHLDLSEVAACISGPKRPQDRIELTNATASFEQTLREFKDLRLTQQKTEVTGPTVDDLKDGAVVIAAITSCTNTSNPAVLVAAGLVARKAREKGLTTKPWVKTSLAPGSKAVTDYLDKAGLLDDLEAMGFYLVGYGCTTCIGNSGPLAPEIENTIEADDLMVTSVLSGNRNFEGRIHSLVRANYLASPPLVVAYALTGNLRLDLTQDPIGQDQEGQDVFLKDLWPDSSEIEAIIDEYVTPGLFREKYADVYNGNQVWNGLEVTTEKRFDWPGSTYVKKPSFFDGLTNEVIEPEPVTDARCLIRVGDSITTDHISPAGSIDDESPAGEYLQENQVSLKDFNSYGSRRGNHEVMMRGTFANVRFKNQLAPGTEGSWTTHFPTREKMSVFAAAKKYRSESVPLIVLAGAEYGTGSSRDWAAKGPSLLGVTAVIAKGFERIHRSNLIGMGILPLQFKSGEGTDEHALDGSERYSIGAVGSGQKEVSVTAVHDSGKETTFIADIRIDTPNEFLYYQNGGILHYVLRNLSS